MKAIGSEIGPGQFWRCLGERPVGATIVTTSGPTGQAGFLGLSFAHISADPPIILVSAGLKTSALDVIARSGVFAVNQLSAGDQDIAKAFGGGVPAEERFALGTWSEFITGAPVLETAVAVFDCKVINSIETESAVTFFGTVEAVMTREGTPLVSHRGGFTTF